MHSAVYATNPRAAADVAIKFLRNQITNVHPREVMDIDEEAFRIGLLNHYLPNDDLLQKATEIARQIAENDPRMVQGIKEIMIDNVGDAWRRMFDKEGEALSGKLTPTPILEGFKDFLNRKGLT